MDEISVGNLVFESTRRCQANCKHCARGKQENLDLSSDIIPYVFNHGNYKITMAGLLFITGGEPFCNKEFFLDLLDYVMRYDIKIGKFGCITNSLKYDQDILNKIKELQNYFACKVLLESKIDQFHQEVPLTHLAKFKEYYYYVYEKINLSDHEIIPIGNAYFNHIGSQVDYDTYQDIFKKAEFSKLRVNYFFDNFINIDSLYISAKNKFGTVPYISTWPMVDEVILNDLFKDSYFKDCIFKYCLAADSNLENLRRELVQKDEGLIRKLK